MGIFFSRFTEQQRNVTDVVIDIENSVPETPEDKKLCERLRTLMQNAPALLSALNDYKGCGDQIRKALTTPCKENDDEAWTAVVPCVMQQKEFYEFSTNIESAVLALCQYLMVIKESNIQQHQAVVRELCLLFDFVSHFDEKKMMCPHIQNDFSYYRRTISRHKSSFDQESRLKDELTNKISLFFASPTPMMKVVIDTTRKFLLETRDVLNPFTDSLSTVTNVLQSTLQRKRIQTPASIDAATRCMVVSLILYDHVHPLGAFHRASPIQIRPCIELLKRSEPPQNSLLNSIRFTTIHVNDSTTPANIKALLSN